MEMTTAANRLRLSASCSLPERQSIGHCRPGTITSSYSHEFSRHVRPFTSLGVDEAFPPAAALGAPVPPRPLLQSAGRNHRETICFRAGNSPRRSRNTFARKGLDGRSRQCVSDGRSHAGRSRQIRGHSRTRARVPRRMRVVFPRRRNRRTSAKCSPSTLSTVVPRACCPGNHMARRNRDRAPPENGARRHRRIGSCSTATVSGPPHACAFRMMPASVEWASAMSSTPARDCNPVRLAMPRVDCVGALQSLCPLPQSARVVRRANPGLTGVSLG